MSGDTETKTRRDDGFTLFEAIIAIAIFSAAIVSFSMFVNPSRKGVNLTAFTTQISTGLRAARSQAVAGNKQVSFVFDVHARKAFVMPGDLEYSIPASFKFDITAARLPTLSPNQSQIMFFGDGSSSGGTIDISSGNSTNRVEVVWLTGGVSVIELP